MAKGMGKGIKGGVKGGIKGFKLANKGLDGAMAKTVGVRTTKKALCLPPSPPPPPSCPPFSVCPLALLHPSSSPPAPCGSPPFYSCAAVMRAAQTSDHGAVSPWCSPSPTHPPQGYTAAKGAKEEAAFRAEFDKKKKEREKGKGSSAVRAIGPCF